MGWLEWLRVWLNIRAAKRYWASGVPSTTVASDVTATVAQQLAAHWLGHPVRSSEATVSVQIVTHADHECFVLVRSVEKVEQGGLF